MAINRTPHNIGNYAGREWPGVDGGTVLLKRSHQPGLGWDVLTRTPPNPNDKSDHGMFPARSIAQGLDIWTACRMFNELAQAGIPKEE